MAALYLTQQTKFFLGDLTRSWLSKHSVAILFYCFLQNIINTLENLADLNLYLFI